MNSHAGKDKPFFSLIIATYNSESYLEECLSSITEQESASYEIIIIDGASQDSTCKIIHTFLDKLKYFESSPDNGIYDAWNKALDHVDGKWIYFLGSDDKLLDSNALLRIQLEIERISDPEIRIFYTQVHVLDEQKNFKYIQNKPWSHIKNRFFQINSIHHQGVFHKRELFSLHGNFDSSFQIAGDYEFLLRELKNNTPQFIETSVCLARLGGCSTHIDNAKKALLECKKASEIHTKKIVRIYWFWAYFKLLFKCYILFCFGEKLMSSLLSNYRKIKNNYELS